MSQEDEPSEEPAKESLRVEVNLRPEVVQAIERTSEITEEHRATVISDAIMLYEHVALAALHGKKLLLTEAKGKFTEVTFEPLDRIRSGPPGQHKGFKT